MIRKIFSKIFKNKVKIKQEISACNPCKTFSSQEAKFLNQDIVRILFVSISPQLMGNIKSVWKACEKDKRFIAKMMPLENQHPHQQSKDFISLRKFLIENDIPYHYFNTEFIKKFNPHVIVIPVPYYEMLPPSLLELIHVMSIRIVYIPYGLEIGGGWLQYKLPV